MKKNRAAALASAAGTCPRYGYPCPKANSPWKPIGSRHQLAKHCPPLTVPAKVLHVRPALFVGGSFQAEPENRSDRVRTCVLLVPNQAPSQTGPHFVMIGICHALPPRRQGHGSEYVGIRTAEAALSAKAYIPVKINVETNAASYQS